MLTACLLLGGALTVQAFRRPRRQRLLPRLLAGWVAVIALGLLAYPPSHRALTPAPVAVLLTDGGYSIDTLRALLHRLGPQARVLRYSPTVASDTPACTNLLALREQYPQQRILHVLGAGIPAADVPLLGPMRQRLHPRLYQGFEQAHWNRYFSLGQALRVEGRFTSPATRGPVWLYLQASGAPRDSVRLAGGTGSFRLRYLPRATGVSVYHLEARRNGRVLASEPVPVEVVGAPTLRVLLLASAPSFEFRFLKNHLASRQHTVALRTTISRNLIQKEFLNQPPHDVSRLTPGLLERYDLLVSDAAALSTISGNESGALQAAIRRQGLGLVVLAESSSLPRTIPAATDFHPTASADSAAQLLTWPDVPARMRASLPYSLRPGGLARSLVSDFRQRTAVASRRYGLGTIVVSMVTATFQWPLENNLAAYDAYWSRLLTAASRPSPHTASGAVLTAWPSVLQPLTLRLEAPVTDPQPRVRPLHAAGSFVQLGLRQDQRLPEWSTAQYWPHQPGWHLVRQTGSSPFTFYVFSAKDWRGPKSQLNRAAAHDGVRPGKPVEERAMVQEKQVAWDARWLMLLFVLAAGFLWLEEKL
ncbi:hypothetical protein LJY25_05805 [Hymenobacter sp. BT175]|nr:hypothetical protein [Hymenobacter translucens]